MKYTIPNTSIIVEDVTAIKPRCGYPLNECDRQEALHIYGKGGEGDNWLIDCVIFGNSIGALEMPETEEELWQAIEPGYAYADRKTLSTIRGEGEDQNRELEWDEGYESPVKLGDRLSEMMSEQTERLDALDLERTTLEKWEEAGFLPKDGVAAAVAQILAEVENLNKLYNTCWSAYQSLPDWGRTLKRIRKDAYLSTEQIALIEAAKRARIKAEERLCRAFGWGPQVEEESEVK